ncbi:MAG: tetraacyldisaccharide 4'-kinase [Candidatus Omnitrophica bacterium]|nr:tetraacyldisaccharide 4'-kinase [Candidatus Omnitrophota bacterium]
MIKSLLYGLSFFYRIGLLLVQLSYCWGWHKQVRLPRPVISVGNITVGGVGKTPLVEFLTRLIKNKYAFRPCILLRGYMGENFLGGTERKVESDEGMMLKENLPGICIGVGQDRAKIATEFLKNESMDVFILDDGFQHWALDRDLDVVVIDATNPFGNGQLLPRGILREPLSALRRADVFVLTKCDMDREHLPLLRSTLQRFNPRAPIIETIHEPVAFKDLIDGSSHPLDELLGQSVAMVSSIGDPAGFEKTLQNLEIPIMRKFSFLDHHPYAKNDMQEIIKGIRQQGITTIVTTQKDAVKLRTFEDILKKEISQQYFRIFVLQIEIKITREEHELLDRIYSLLPR